MRSEEKANKVIKMNSKVYKWCAVPQCRNTSIITPDKVFVHVPHKKIIRTKWLKLARRNPNDVVTKTSLYFCEDHFDLPNDMENYMEYHVMGSVSQVRMKPGCMPRKFVCQPDRQTRIPGTTERPYIAKKRRMMILEQCMKEFEEKSIVTEQSSSQEIASTSSGPLHHFPKPKLLNMERFNLWKAVLRPETQALGYNYLFQQVRLCYRHFEYYYSLPSKHLTRNAIPTLNIGKDKTNERTIVKIDNNAKIIVKPSESNSKKFPDYESSPGPSIDSVNDTTDSNIVKLDYKQGVYTGTYTDDDFQTFDDVTIEEVPVEAPKEFTWQDPKAAVNLVEDEDENTAGYIQDDLLLYCSDDEDRKLLYDINAAAEDHACFRCNSCNQEIVGYRYVCVQCSDFDLCSKCENKGVHDQHYVLRVPGPKPYLEVQKVLARIRKYLTSLTDPTLVADDAVSIKTEIKVEQEEDLTLNTEEPEVSFEKEYAAPLREDVETSFETEEEAPIETEEEEALIETEEEEALIETEEEEALIETEEAPIQTGEIEALDDDFDYENEETHGTSKHDAETSQDEDDPLRIHKTTDDETHRRRYKSRLRVKGTRQRHESAKSTSDNETAEESGDDWRPTREDRETEKSDLKELEDIRIPKQKSKPIVKIASPIKTLNQIVEEPPTQLISKQSPKVVLDVLSFEKLTGTKINTEGKVLSKRKICITRSDYEKILKSQPPVKKVCGVNVTKQSGLPQRPTVTTVLHSSSGPTEKDSYR